MKKYSRWLFLGLNVLVVPFLYGSCSDLDFQESEESGEGSHRPGEDCGSCHGNQARAFTVSGTIYKDASGSAAAPGSVIVIKDTNGGELFRLTSDSNGNFYTNKSLVYPAKAESPGSNKSMVQSFSATGASCNNSSCHTSSMRIY
ncbi:MAG: carboxypeptidase-like regulatory domain-containing protein [Spirochaetia bacterium]|nr:carboxypeptidase-like regulatory domain-containing protein [Spirochaetia bacterium]